MDATDTPNASATLYTIGHSNQTVEDFLALLARHGIEALVDVRSAPYSRYVPHFNKRELQQAMQAAGLHYVYLGRELGGRPEDLGLYDEAGHARYDLIAETETFNEGIERLKTGLASYRVAIMCSEEDPTDCHRRLLVGRVMRRDGYRVLHIRGDGEIMNDVQFDPSVLQPGLFGLEPGAPETWRSTRSVLPRSPRSSSSDS
jgi:uncharacterized protein (DUF488 family)